MPKIDIVIAHRGPEMGLWMTLASCTQELENQRVWDSRTDWHFYVTHNGDEKIDWPTENIVTYMGDTGRLTYHHVPDAMSPPSARNLGAKEGNGEVIFFLDNHCIVQPGFFDQALHTMNRYNADAVHSVTKFWPGAKPRYHYRFTLERNFWAYQVDETDHCLPYMIGGGAHGAFAVRRSVWEELGGYWNGFKGYGGEEMYWELLMGLTDKKNYLDPDMIHWHHPGARPYPRETSLDFLTNMMSCANIIGGEKWLNRVSNGLSLIESRATEPREIDFGKLRLYVLEKTGTQADLVRKISKRTLNEQLLHFQKIGVAL